MVEAQHNMDSNKIEMGESSSSSVSFGKYENDDDVICWEKWSPFSSPNNHNNNNSNKYLDEVGKFSTPGSVAQKKAFFEAHYKKIAAMKKMKAAEEEAHQQQNPHLSSSSSTEDESVKCQPETGGNRLSHFAQEATTPVDDQTFQPESCNALKPQHLSPPALNNNVPINLEKEEVEAVLVNNQILQDESCDAPGPQNLLSSQSAIPINRNGDKLEEAVLVNNQSMKLVKQHFQVEPDIEFPRQTNQQVPKPKSRHVAPKVNPTKVGNNLVGRKIKPASMMPKSPETSSTRLSKPKATTTPMTTPRSSLNKTIASSPSSSKSKNPSVSESRRIAPTSLHLSMSMSSVHSDTASSVTSSRRRSTFMEQMGDKDIVKRAFKTFQNRYNQLPSSDGRSSEAKQIPTKGSGQKASTSMTSQKENERSRKAPEKIYHSRGQIGPTWKSVSSGSLKGVGVDERRLKTTPTSVNLRSDERAERRKEFFKNLEEKSNARDAERSQLSSKSKEAKDAEIKTLRQNLNFKAKPMPSFYRAQGLSKNTSEKEAMNNGTTKRLDSHR